MATLESATAKRPQIHASWPSSRCHAQCGSFQTSCPHPPLWNGNLEFHLFPYLRVVWGWWWCPGWKACSLSLLAPSDGFSLQEKRALIFADRIPGWSACLHQENNKLLRMLVILYERSYFLIEGLFSCITYCSWTGGRFVVLSKVRTQKSG